ncbi:ABC transporter substrate-binding protein, partial [Thermodesulfobacteriota bacterium]
MKKNRVVLGISFACLFMLLGTSFALAEVGVTDTTIKIGSIQDTTGPLAVYGIPRVESLEAYVKHINEAGGIHGRKIVLRHESDLYKPPNTVMAFKKLVDL